MGDRGRGGADAWQKVGERTGQISPSAGRRRRLRGAARFDRVFASPADYHSHSFYTFRWVPANLKTHVFRALDDARPIGSGAPRMRRQSNQTERFPSEWNAAKRKQTAAELNELNAFNHYTDKAAAMEYYRTLSNDGLRAGRVARERAFTQLTIQPLDPKTRTTSTVRAWIILQTVIDPGCAPTSTRSTVASQSRFHRAARR
jgi:hypothetical protein